MSDIEQQFFKTFGIKPKQFKICTNASGCPEKYKLCNELCKHWQIITEEYPEITAEIILELICILNTITIPDFGDINVGRLKLSILEQCIEALKKVDWQNRMPTKEEYIDEVRALFGGEE